MKIKKISFLLVLLFSFNLFGANSKNISNISKLNVSKKSVSNGPVKTYYKNGKIKSKEYYTGNKKTGIWQYYHENGKIKTEVMFNALSKDEEAIVKTYDEMGRKLNTYDLTKGVIVTYSEKGKVILKVSEKALLNRLEEIMVEVNNDRARANEEKN